MIFNSKNTYFPKIKLKKHKIIYVDVDGTICENLEDMKEKQPDATYADAKPFHNRIKIINELFDEGHEIHYWTARGVHSGIDWTELTKTQLLKWGVKILQIHPIEGGRQFWTTVIPGGYGSALI